MPDAMESERRSHLSITLDATTMERVKRGAFAERMKPAIFCAKLLTDYLRDLDKVGMLVPRNFTRPDIPVSIVPPDPHWANHPDSERIRERLLIIDEMQAAGSLSAGAELVAKRLHTPGRRDGFSPENLRRMAADYLVAMDWTVLVDKTEHPVKPRKGTPYDSPEFATWLHSIPEPTRGDRRGWVMRLAHEIQERFRKGEPIPGYGDWREHWVWMQRRRTPPELTPDAIPDDFTPHGCSYRNLLKRFGGTPAATKEKAVKKQNRADRPKRQVRDE